MDQTTLTYSITDAAVVCGVHRDTIRRLLRAGRLPNATRPGGVNGPWRIGAGDLAAAGLRIDPASHRTPDASGSVAGALRACATALDALADALEGQVAS